MFASMDLANGLMSLEHFVINERGGVPRQSLLFRGVRDDVKLYLIHPLMENRKPGQGPSGESWTLFLDDLCLRGV